MNQILAFFLKSIISSGILFCYYCLVLRNRKFHQYNRFYLLFTLILSVVIPFLDFRLYDLHEKVYTNLSPTSINLISNTLNQSNTSFNWLNLLLVALISVSLILLYLLASKIGWIYQLKHQHSIIKMQGFNLIETNVKQAPFSFLNNLFWRKNISMSDEIGKKIFAHELTHIKGKHTYDNLFSQLMICFFWINPFYWLIQQELIQVHEFIADTKSVQQGDTQSFAEMLLQSHNEGRYLNPSHSFFNSSIKRRIIMLTTSKNAQYSWLRKVCALPILLLVTILFSFKIVNAQTDPKLNSHDSVTVKKVTIHPQNDSLAQVAIDYVDAKGKRDTLNITAGYSKNDSSKANIVYDEESGERREVSAAETREIVNQIIQNPPAEDIYFVDGSEYSPASIKKLDPQKIKTINIYNGSEAVKRYGERAKNGVVVLTTK